MDSAGPIDRSLTKAELVVISTGIAIGLTIPLLAFVSAGVSKVAFHATFMAIAFGCLFPTTYVLMIKRHPIAKKLHVQLNSVAVVLACTGYLLAGPVHDGTSHNIGGMHGLLGSCLILLVAFQAVTGLSMVFQQQLPTVLRDLHAVAHAPVGKLILALSLMSMWFTVFWWKSLSSMFSTILVTTEIVVMAWSLWKTKE